MERQIPQEFDIVKTGSNPNRIHPSGLGYTMRGWDFSRTEIADALDNNKMLNPAYELASNTCPWNCFFCFTEDPENPDGRKLRLKQELSLEERLQLLQDSKDLGARSINIIGAGEPTVDPHFWKIIDYINQNDMTPIVYTEGALRLTRPEFAKRLYDAGATVVLKVNSLENETYQNAVVTGGTPRASAPKMNYFEKRNEALEVLMDAGFNDSDPTRLAFDTIICQENYAEIPNIHRFARNNNIFTLFVGYLPSGRSSTPAQNAVSRQDQFKMFGELAKIDQSEYGLEHQSKFPYAGGVPCTIRGLGMYAKIQGEAYDCPGESQHLGNIRDVPLKEIWEKTKNIRSCFDGGCAPRDLFWEAHEGK